MNSSDRADAHPGIRSQRFRVTIEACDESFDCNAGEDVLSAMRNSLCRQIPVGCCNGGCGACRISISSGTYTTRKMSRAVISESDEAARCVLACRTVPLSDLQVRVLGRMWPPQTTATTKSSDEAVATAQAETKVKRRG